MDPFANTVCVCVYVLKTCDNENNLHGLILILFNLTIDGMMKPYKRMNELIKSEI